MSPSSLSHLAPTPSILHSCLPSDTLVSRACHPFSTLSSRFRSSAWPILAPMDPPVLSKLSARTVWVLDGVHWLTRRADHMSLSLSPFFSVFWLTSTRLQRVAP